VQLFLAFIVALSITAALIPLLARWAPSVGLTDRPGPRKVHSVPVPRIGGIAMACGILAPALILLEPTPALRGLLLGVVVLLIVGVWDDRVELGYGMKFLGQMVAVGLCVGLGDVRIEAFMSEDRVALPHLLSQALTFVFLIGVTNAVNLSDGLDGLAGGMALLCFSAIALLAAAGGNGAVTALALIEAGAIMGFLRFNTHPARVFMGDGGSQVLGFTIGVLAILATQRDVPAPSATLPLLLIGMPIIDTAAVMLQRIREGRSPFTSDRNHLHHRLLGLGFRHGEAVMLLYLSQVVLFLLAYFLRFEPDLVVVTTFCAFALALLGVIGWASRSGWRAHGTAAHDSLRSFPQLRVSLRRLPELALWVMGGSMLLYAVTVIAESDRVGSDVSVLCVLMLIALLATNLPRVRGSAEWLERATAYVSVVMLVYLDQTTHGKSALLSGTSWTLLGITGAAALARFWLSPTRRFQVTPLDVLVVFIAFVIPNLPGSVPLPPDLPAGIAKAVILLYVVEMLLSVHLKRPVPRAFLVIMLAAIAIRGFIAPGL
jgi:UDP-GlcNAc:undecaprenyl-phosphate GlcNAc-1-phosphate transferase